MKYRVWHRTTYTYDDVVDDSYGIARLAPRELSWQHVAARELVVEPAPDDRSEDVDAAGNTTTYFQVGEGHRVLRLVATSEVEVQPPAYDAQALDAPWETARPLVHPHAEGAWRAVDLALPSPLAPPTEAARAYAAESLTPGRPLAEAVDDLVGRLHADLVYRPGTTTVTTTVDDVLAARTGVCQDFAHVALACLRSHGLAARYVSGYLATDAPPGRDRVVGADASHAWVAVWWPGADDDAWLAVDPTNDVRVADRHVTLAWGRDYADVAPVTGVIFSEATASRLLVEVDVAPLDLPG